MRKSSLQKTSKTLCTLVLSSVVIFGTTLGGKVRAQTDSDVKVIDFHLHPPDTALPILPPHDFIAQMDQNNIELAVLTGATAYLNPWSDAHPDRFIPALQFPCINGNITIGSTDTIQCFEGNKIWPDIDWLEEEIKAGRIKMLGEVTTEYIGLYPNDSKLEPYYELAERYDIPFLIHMGLGPPNAAHNESFRAAGHFRAATSRPIFLEEVLLKHPKLRVVVMHSGWPYSNDMVNMLYHHHNLYVDTAALQLLARKEYYRHLKQIVDAGFGDRVLYAFDFGLKIKDGIDAILVADFLTDQQKEDILYNNARRFLGLDKSK